MFRFILAAFAFVFSSVLSESARVSVGCINSTTRVRIHSQAWGVDAQGNTYIAGSTLSASFPVKAAVQNHLASAGLYRIDGPGPAYTALGLTSAPVGHD